MASMLENVLGYLRPKSQSQSEETADENCPPPAKTCPDCGTETDEDTDWVYDIEDQDEWQIVRKMDEDEVDYLDEKDENDEDAEQAELEDEASTARQAMLCRSAPAAIMERTLAGQLPMVVPDVDAGLQENSPPKSRFGNDDQVAVVPPKPMSNKRKRRIRQQQQLERTATNHPPDNVPAAPQQRTELGVVRTAEETDKIAQNEDRQRRLAKNVLAKAQLQRVNILTDHNVPKRAGNRDGNYRCMH